MAILYIFHAETSTGQNYECNRHDYICYRQELYTFRHALITLLILGGSMSRFALGGPPGAKLNDMSHFGPFLRVSIEG